jgi:hypothetical protein
MMKDAEVYVGPPVSAKSLAALSAFDLNPAIMRIAELEAALEPFAKRADAWNDDVPDEERWTICNGEGDCIAYDLTPGDFRRARNVLQ